MCGFSSATTIVLGAICWPTNQPPPPPRTRAAIAAPMRGINLPISASCYSRVSWCWMAAVRLPRARAGGYRGRPNGLRIEDPNLDPAVTRFAVWRVVIGDRLGVGVTDGGDAIRLDAGLR